METESFATAYDCKEAMPGRAEEACRLNMNFKHNGQTAQQTKDRRLWKPCINQISFQPRARRTKSHVNMRRLDEESHSIGKSVCSP